MDQQAHNALTARLEALLFVRGEPIGLGAIVKVLEISEEDLGAAVSGLREKLSADDRGLMIVEDGEKIQLATKPQFGSLLERFVKEEIAEDLTPASVEALSIVSYLGPISRSRIEYVRGVNSSFTLRNLMIRGLIERSPDPSSPSGYVYQASFDLLRHLGVEKKEDLPDFQKFRALLAQFETGAHE